MPLGRDDDVAGAAVTAGTACHTIPGEGHDGYCAVMTSWAAAAVLRAMSASAARFAAAAS